MGGNASRDGAPGEGDSAQDKKDKKAKKYEAPAPTRVGKKKKKKSGPTQSSKLPSVVPASKCKLRLLKVRRGRQPLRPPIPSPTAPRPHPRRLLTLGVECARSSSGSRTTC